LLTFVALPSSSLASCSSRIQALGIPQLFLFRLLILPLVFLRVDRFLRGVAHLDEQEDIGDLNVDGVGTEGEPGDGYMQVTDVTWRVAIMRNRCKISVGSVMSDGGSLLTFDHFYWQVVLLDGRLFEMQIVQRQIACKLNHNSVWQTHADYAKNERTGHDRQVQVICVEVVNVWRDEFVDELRMMAILMSVVGQTGTDKDSRGSLTDTTTPRTFIRPLILKGRCRPQRSKCLKHYQEEVL
jgi:hypothetical protein